MIRQETNWFGVFPMFGELPLVTEENFSASLSCPHQYRRFISSAGKLFLRGSICACCSECHLLYSDLHHSWLCACGCLCNGRPCPISCLHKHISRHVSNSALMALVDGADWRKSILGWLCKCLGSNKAHQIANRPHTAGWVISSIWRRSTQEAKSVHCLSHANGPDVVSLNYFI